MKRLTLIAAFAAALNAFAATPADDQWASAQTEQQAGGPRVFYRYVEKFGGPLERSAFHHLFVVTWHYGGTEGMPAKAEAQAMYEFEDALLERLEKPGRARLVLVSTGEHQRAWTYYARSAAEFGEALARSGAPSDRYPVRISARQDPQWQEYERFKSSVRQK
jgi:hypothetical protein